MLGFCGIATVGDPGRTGAAALGFSAMPILPFERRIPFDIPISHRHLPGVRMSADVRVTHLPEL